MNKRTYSISASIAQSMAFLGVLVASLLLYRWAQLRVQSQKESQALLFERSAKVVSTLGADAVLPENKPLTVCNPSTEPVNIVAIAATYRSTDGNLKTFNSTRGGRRSWLIPPGSKESLNLLEGSKMQWDGSVIFYALDTRSKGKAYFLSGTADQLPASCLSLATN